MSNKSIKKPNKILITGANSGIGSALIDNFKSTQITIDGTFRNKNPFYEKTLNFISTYSQVDFSNATSIDQWLEIQDFSNYDALVFIHGTMTPIGKLHQVTFDDWQRCNYTNYLSIVQVLHHALPALKTGCKVITLAGGGVNGAPESYSAYTNSKMSLVKMNELLAADYPEQIFINIGPGWVDTPIHQQTLHAHDLVPEASAETLRRYNAGEFIPMEQVIHSLTYLLEQSNRHFSGRNFSVSSKELFNEKLPELLKQYDDLFKLRRVAGVPNETH